MILQQAINGLMLGAIYVFVALAFSLVIGILNFVNFSMPALFMIGSMVCWASTKAGLPLLLSILLGLTAAGCASLVVQFVTYRKMRSDEPVVALIASLAFLLFFENVAYVIWGTDQQTFPSVAKDFNLRSGDLVIGGGQLISLMLSLAGAALLSLVLAKTSFGRATRAIAEDPISATYLGVPIDRVVPVIFVLAGVFAGLGGILFSINYLQVSAHMGQEIGLKGIAAMIVGGVGSVWGAVLGGLIIGLAEVLAIWGFGSSAVDIAVYGLLLSILVLRPTGLFGGSSFGRQRA